MNQIKHRALWRSAGYVGGKWLEKKPAFSVLNPGTGEEIATCPRMNAADAHDAAVVSYDAWQSWKTSLASERGKIIRRMADLMGKYSDDLATIITLESGKPLAEAKGEVAYARSFYDLYAEEATRVLGTTMPSIFHGQRMMTLMQPVGPSALITPWNFPCAMVTRKVGPALAAGCTVVLKPSEETPLSALALCAIAEEAGVPPGVLNCLTVSREDVKAVGEALCHSDKIRKLSFTGSTAVGKFLMRESASTVKKVSLELGGNAPFIVFDDADIDVAIKAVLLTKFRNAGQACIASNRILVQGGIYEQFAQKLSEKVASMVVGNGLQKGVSLGPLVNQKGLQKVTSHVDDCIAKGAKLLTGGPVDASMNATGATFYKGTVLAGVTEDMAPFREETFGPLAALMMFKTEEEAIRIANDTQYGLAAYVCTRDNARIWRVSEALEFGMIGVNNGTLSAATTPFGGMKESGIGREGGPWGIQEFLEVKYVGIGI